MAGWGLGGGIGARGFRRLDVRREPGAFRDPERENGSIVISCFVFTLILVLILIFNLYLLP